MAEFAYTEALRVLSTDASVDLGRLLAAACAPACDPVVYLADFSRLVLLPLTAGLPAEQVEGTLPGRAFTTGEPAVSARDGYARVWVPVLEQTARAGVLAVSLPDAGADSVRQAELLGVFAGTVLAGMSRVTDAPRAGRQDRSMSLPASMQWDLLPPWALRMPGALVAGILEPAYDIAGDAYDYAAGDGILHFAVVDGMGHGLGSTLLAALAVGAYRHARRAAAPAQAVHAAIDEALASGYEDLSFATGLIGTLTAATGRLEWTCAGHPPPLLLRADGSGGAPGSGDAPGSGEPAGQLALPFPAAGSQIMLGVIADACYEADEISLYPGDVLMAVTDGVTERRDDYGRLLDDDGGLARMLANCRSLSATGVAARIGRAVSEFGSEPSADDMAILVLRAGPGLR
jgi:hypothetical protein